MERDELKTCIRGTIATLPTAFDGGLNLDLARMTDLTRWWVGQGLGTRESPLKVCAAMGEGPDLGDDEWPHLLRTVVNAAGGAAPVICALKSKNTLHTIEDAKRAQGLGAVGLQIDLPLYHHPTQDDYVRFFSDVSAAIDIGIIIYNTHWFGCESVTPATMLRLADAEHVVAIKWHVPETQDYDGMREFAHVFNVIDNSGQIARCHRNGGCGYISATIAAYPHHDKEIWHLLQARRYEEAQALYDRVEGALRPLMTRLSGRSGGYRFGKALMAVSGHSAGPPRPPTLPLDKTELEELRKVLEDLGWPVAENGRAR